MKRYIEIEQVEGLSYRIVKQTHVGEAFNSNKEEWKFIASNGFSLHSSLFPQLYGALGLACRGYTVLGNDRVFVFTSEAHVAACLQAIREYNYGSKTPCSCNSAIMCDYCFKRPKEALAF